MTSETNDAPEVEVIVDETPQSGLFNMSMDAALLQLAMERERSTVRIYQWTEPTVTLGYFQGSGDSVESAFAGLPVVRRLSGGGAILHDQEITYSLVLPASHPARQDPSSVYEMVHRAIIELLCNTGFPCQLRSEYDEAGSLQSKTATAQTPEPFLCFLRKNPNDIVSQSGHKVVGSAQRRRKGVTLQHGSVLLRSSSYAPQVPGIADLMADFRMNDFLKSLPQAIASVAGGISEFRGYTDEEKDLASSIAVDVA
ncbi:MAG TPA: biotin/lipoate A/B protein ligase family protein [Planctomycetaceae bacterium]|nr:biotin/lipoate A/B protein ligase family protein [Planctomycetaceae bacterium]